MEERNSILKRIFTTITIIVILVVSYQVYKKYSFGEYTKAELYSKTTSFERDSNVTFADYNSYKIENKDYNDAMFYKKVSVTPDTVYRVTCKVKTENVQVEQENKDAGAHICVVDTVEKSDNVLGNSDWTEIEFVFNSKNRTEIEIGFRLGGNESLAIGTAWFSDFNIEVGIADETNTWNFLCILFDNTDIDITSNEKSQHISLELSQTDKEDIKSCMQRFKLSMEEMTYNKMKVNYDVVETSIPINTLSYDVENGYYVAPYDVKAVLDEYIKKGKYDHIFIAFRTGDLNKKGIALVSDWIGLGSMEYRGIGFSNIRLPDDESNYIYKYDSRINLFPEEVLVHEFLHTLERNSKDYGYERPELHSYEKYGYQNEKLIGLKNWYKDYLNSNIKTSQGYIGLNEAVYTIKPGKITDFEYSRELGLFKEPANILEELNIIAKKIFNIFR